MSHTLSQQPSLLGGLWVSVVGSTLPWLLSLPDEDKVTRSYLLLESVCRVYMLLLLWLLWCLLPAESPPSSRGRMVSGCWLTTDWGLVPPALVMVKTPLPSNTVCVWEADATGGRSFPWREVRAGGWRVSERGEELPLPSTRLGSRMMGIGRVVAEGGGGGGRTVATTGVEDVHETGLVVRIVIDGVCVPVGSAPWGVGVHPGGVGGGELRLASNILFCACLRYEAYIGMVLV